MKVYEKLVVDMTKPAREGWYQVLDEQSYPYEGPTDQCMPPVIFAIAVAVVNIGAAVGVVVPWAIASGIASSLVIGSVMMGANVALSHIIPHASAHLDPATQQVNIKQPISYRQIVYGTRRLGGVITFGGISGSKKEYLHLVLSLAGHEVDNIGSMYFNDILTAPDGSVVVLEKNLGDPNSLTQPFAGLSADMPIWSSTYRQRGCAKVHVRLKWDPDKFASGVPTITFDVRGKKVFDPRTSQTAYAENPALVLRDFLTDAMYGMKVNPAAIDDAAVIAAANVCDENVILREGGTQKRYAANGVFDASQQRGEVIKSILSAMAGILVPPGDAWRMFAGSHRLPVMSITDSDLRGPIKIDTRVSRADLCNSVHGTYVSPQNKWQPSDFPGYKSQLYIDEDGGEVLWKDTALDWETDPIRAQRLAKIQVEQARRKTPLVLPCKLRCFPAEPGDTVQFTHARWGINAKTYLVSQASLVREGDADKPVLGYDLVLYPTDSTVWSWDPNVDEGSVVPITAPPLPDVSSCSSPTGLTVESDEATQIRRADGIVHTQIKLNWTPPEDASVISGGAIEVWVKKNADATYRLDGRAGGSDTEYFISNNIVDGQLYNIRVCAVNAAGAHSASLYADVVAGSTPSQLTSTKGQVPINTTSTFLGPNPLHQASAGSKVINVSGFSIQWGFGTVDYSAGSLTASSAGFGVAVYVFLDDPTYVGGSLPFQYTLDPLVLYQNDGRLYIGSITLAASGSPGGGGGGGGGGCPIEGTLVEPLSNMPCTRHLVSWKTWVEIRTENGCQLTAVPLHQVYCDRGKIALEDLTTEDMVVTKRGASRVISVHHFERPARKIHTEMPDGHLYWANEILSHNVKPPYLPP